MTPTFVITGSGGTDLTALIKDRLLRLEVVDNTTGKNPDKCTFLLDDRDQRLRPPERGVKLKVAMGYKETGTHDMGTFVVEGVESSGWPLKMQVTATSVDQNDKMKDVNTKTYEEKSLVSIFGDVALRAGYKAITGSGFNGIQYKVKHQNGESNIAFLKRLAEENGGFVKISDGSAILQKAGSKESPSGGAISEVTVDGRNTTAPGSIKGFSVKVQDDSNFKEAEETAHEREEDGGDPDGDDEETEGSGSGKSKAKHKGRHHAPTKNEKRTKAGAKASKLKRDMGNASFQLIGEPRIRAGMPLTVQNVRRGTADGQWVIISATHTIDGSGGFTTSIECNLPPDKSDFSGDTARTNASGGEVPGTFAGDSAWTNSKGSVNGASISPSFFPIDTTKTPSGSASP
jgi:uncharacterized protein